jgi:hypothetical protein
MAVFVGVRGGGHRRSSSEEGQLEAEARQREVEEVVASEYF